MKPQTYLTQGITCVIIQDDKRYLATTSGIRPLLDWLAENPSPLYHGDVADRVVGKAAALLFRYAKIHSLYTKVISKHALDTLQDSGIEVQYEKLVPYIINRKKDGMCPMEKKVLDIDDPSTAYEILK